jgi:protein tyrosine phosphatase (PTP) superfamily phosphohydrolase (DUF442 family)
VGLSRIAWLALPCAIVAGVGLLARWRPGYLAWLVRHLSFELADRAYPDVSWIADDLAIGGRILDREWSDLAASGVQAVVDCRQEGRDPEALLTTLGLTFLHVPTPDSGNFTPLQVAETVDWIEQRWAEGQRVLVHCQAGKGRSVLIGAAALSRRGLTAEDAVSLIRQRRPIITPTPGQLARLRDYALGQQLALPLTTSPETSVEGGDASPGH